ncbi:MAG: hypothetical protein M5U26_03495 [Planctomycetota bacterium]|nr:hypothetical protein [Planctomycetota bacterium]
MAFANMNPRGKFFTVGYGYTGPGDGQPMNPLLAALSGGAQPSAFEQKYTAGLEELLNTPGLSADEINSRVSQSRDNLGESERDAGMNLRQSAAAMGFGRSGDLLKGQRTLAGQYAGLRADAERKIRTDAANTNLDAKYKALGLAGQEVASQRAQASAQQNRLLEALKGNAAVSPDPRNGAQYAGAQAGYQGRGSALGLTPGSLRGSLSAPKPSHI